MRNNRFATKGKNSPGYVGGNYKIIENIKTKNVINFNFPENIKIFRALLEFFKSTVIIPYTFSNKSIIDSEQVSDMVFNDSLSIGNQVTITGYLSKYLLSHRSSFYTLHTRKAGKLIEKSGNKFSLEIQSIPTPLPMQSFPPVTENGTKRYIYFIYPKSISTFVVTPKGENNIDKKNKPLMLLSPTELLQESEKVVNVTGILCVPQVYKGLNNLTDIQKNIISNIYRPYNESIKSFCISTFDTSRSEIKIINHKESFNGIVYAETHFEGTENINYYVRNDAGSSDTNLFDFMSGRLLPNAVPGLHWCGNINVPRASDKNFESLPSGMCQSDVVVKTKNFREFSYFIETDIVNLEINNDKIQTLRDFIDRHRKNVRNYFQANCGLHINNAYDFLYDFNKIPFFHQQGKMSSKEDLSDLLDS
jgi:hypothetical protein